MTTSVRTHEFQKYMKIFQMEYGIDAKSFCNCFRSFYYGGGLWTCSKLVRQRHCLLTGSVRLNLPMSSDPDHHIRM